MNTSTASTSIGPDAWRALSGVLHLGLHDPDFAAIKGRITREVTFALANGYETAVILAYYQRPRGNFGAALRAFRTDPSVVASGVTCRQCELPSFGGKTGLVLVTPEDREKHPKKKEERSPVATPDAQPTLDEQVRSVIVNVLSSRKDNIRNDAPILEVKDRVVRASFTRARRRLLKGDDLALRCFEMADNEAIRGAAAAVRPFAAKVFRERAERVEAALSDFDLDPETKRLLVQLVSYNPAAAGKGSKEAVERGKSAVVKLEHHFPETAAILTETVKSLENARKRSKRRKSALKGFSPEIHLLPIGPVLAAVVSGRNNLGAL